jgi:hypothetical protein
MTASRHRGRQHGVDESRSSAQDEWLQTDCDRRFWRPQSSPVRLHLSLLCDLERVVDLDPEVSHGALKLGVAE